MGACHQLSPTEFQPSPGLAWTNRVRESTPSIEGVTPTQLPMALDEEPYESTKSNDEVYEQWVDEHALESAGDDETWGDPRT